MTWTNIKEKKNSSLSYLKLSLYTCQHYAVKKKNIVLVY